MAATFWVLVACGGGVEPIPPTPDAGLAPDTIRAPIQLVTELLADSAPSWAGALANDGVLAAYPDQVLRIETATTSALSPPAGQLVGVGRWDRGQLVAASDGFYALHEDGLVRSPLSEALAELEPADLLPVERLGQRQLWIAGTEGLAFWAEGRVQRVRPGDLPTAGCSLAHGPQISGVPAVWAACQGQLYGLIDDGTGPKAHLQAAVSDVRSLAADDAGTVWIVNGQGEVWSRGPSGDWRPHDFATEATQVMAAGPDTWIHTASGLWHHNSDGFAEVLDQTNVQPLAATTAGQLVLASDAGLVRGHLQRVVRLNGLTANALLEAATEVAIYPIQPDTVSTVDATLDDQPISVQGMWQVSLDPASLPDGSHTLSVTVTYEDGQALQSDLRFSRYAGPPPTWTQDVEPIFEARCAICHGNDSGARRLDGAALWQEQIDAILLNVTTANMPLPPNPPLTVDELQRIEGWVAAGYPEGD